jgi:cytochrome c-type biogenesis protein CcmH/NrfG
MKRSAIASVAAGLAAITLGACKRDEPVVAAPAVPPGMPQGVPGGLPPPMMAQPGNSDVAKRIDAEKQAVAQDPKNATLWVALGNDYFDTRQAQLAVDAYAKALELKPNDPDVLTDQGVMYRELKNYDRAIANFEKANQINPHHLQSLYNAGVVYGFDLHDVQKATAAFNRVIAADPTSPQAIQARTTMLELQQAPPGR